MPEGVGDDEEGTCEAPHNDENGRKRERATWWGNQEVRLLAWCRSKSLNKVTHEGLSRHTGNGSRDHGYQRDCHLLHCSESLRAGFDPKSGQQVDERRGTPALQRPQALTCCGDGFALVAKFTINLFLRALKSKLAFAGVHHFGHRVRRGRRLALLQPEVGQADMHELLETSSLQSVARTA